VEQPVLRLGLLGFDAGGAQRLAHWAGLTQPGWPVWRESDPHQADAWMIHGGAVEVLGRDGVLIHHPQGSGEWLALNRVEVDRPLAFAAPLPDGFASGEFFQADDEHGVRLRLQRFEAWLRPLRSQFALGARLVERLGRDKNGVVHVLNEGRLLAVIDLDRWQAGLFIPARPVDIDMAEWVSRPRLAGDIPPAFMRLPLQRVLWTYAVRTTRDVLPARYRDQIIHLRRVPRLPARWFDGLHLMLMRELANQPADLQALAQRVGCPLAEVAHHLAALYYAGGVTTDADSARRAAPETRKALLALQFEQADREQDTQGPEATASEQSPPTSILREVRHSPLRTVGRNGTSV
jgi:hypothetical protein